MTEEIKLDNPKLKILIGEDGVPCIVLPTSMRPPIQPFKIHLFELPFRPNYFTEIQRKKERNFIKDILKDLEELFKGR